ncbi:hypothetical protein [Pseudoxanthomonas sp. USHLN014]|uniref:hypothetical protein n=1 Tax=Pseudoxanthomonas sp. USHLN014 TaxID=3081297 RepID=UPI00301D3602
MPQLPLPIAPETAITRVIMPALSLLPARLTDARAIVLLLAIMLQESGLRYRWQVLDPRNPGRKGPARGLAQFERGGGVKGVIEHPLTRAMAADLCRHRGVMFDAVSVWDALDDDDLLAAGFGRLLLFTDPAPLPPLSAAGPAWNYYRRNWRPGAYDRGDEETRNALVEKWRRNLALARAAWDAVEA